MTYVFDIDNTLCHTEGSDYESSSPRSMRIQKVNELYDEGHQIILLTARGMGRSGNCRRKANKLFYSLTETQLNKWGVKYHSLFLGKPAADFYIDDKGINDEDFFTD